MSIMKQILDYIFSGEVSVCVPPAFVLTLQSSAWVLPSQISLDEETIQDMVQASDLLLMTDLKALCCQFLESCITAENCVGIRLFSLRYCLHHVHYVATEFLQTHFGDVARSEEFRELPADQLCELLSMEKLNIGNEEHVLEAVVRWFTHDPEERRVGVVVVVGCPGRVVVVVGCPGRVGAGTDLCSVSTGSHEGGDVGRVDGRPGAELPEGTGEPPPGLHLPPAPASLAVSHQALGEPLMREVVRDYCQPVLERGPLHGEALLATFKPRGYSECIVVVGGEERQ